MLVGKAKVIQTVILCFQTFISLPIISEEGRQQSFLAEKVLITQFVLQCNLLAAVEFSSKHFHGETAHL